MSTITRTISVNVITRAWTDLEPKLLAFLTTGLSAGVITEAANYLGYSINPALAVVIATLVATIAGYLKSSTSKVPAIAPQPVVPAPVAVPVVAVAPVQTVVTPADPSQPAAGTQPAAPAVVPGV